IEKGGEQIHKLTLNLQDLSGGDMIKAARQAQVLGETAPNPLMTVTGSAVIGAMAAGVIVDKIFKLPAPDFILVINTVSNFLFEWALL
ncbi:hypothetical protein ABTQ07_20840, partial [Acinetobacter baumannii]